MIEKFSEEELKQIKQELKALKSQTTKVSVCSKEYTELYNLFKDYPFSIITRISDSCFNMIDIVLNNYEKKQKGCYMNKFVRCEDKDEYCQMFQEILEIIKKHNRKWEGDKE